MVEYLRMKRPDFPIVLEDEHLLIADKPSGLLSIRAPGYDGPTFYGEVRDYLIKRYGKYAKVFIVHRLDKDTSGLMVFAKDFETKERLQALFEEKKVVRRYQAVLSRPLEKKEGRIVQYLAEDRFHNMYAASKNKKGAVEAVTDYRVVSGGKNPKVEILIETGKRNQIRLAFSSLGSPILGDRKFGGDRCSRLMLAATELDLRAYKDDKAYDAFSPKCLF